MDFFPHSIVVVRAPTDVFPLSAWEIAHSVEYLFLASPTVLLLFQLNEIIHIHWTARRCGIRRCWFFFHPSQQSSVENHSGSLVTAKHRKNTTFHETTLRPIRRRQWLQLLVWRKTRSLKFSSHKSVDRRKAKKTFIKIHEYNVSQCEINRSFRTFQFSFFCSSISCHLGLRFLISSDDFNAPSLGLDGEEKKEFRNN